jgi:hypothetical protein
VLDDADVSAMARAVATLLADEPARLAMSKLGRDRTATLSTSRTALVYEERLESLVGHGGRA